MTRMKSNNEGNFAWRWNPLVGTCLFPSPSLGLLSLLRPSVQVSVFTSRHSLFMALLLRIPLPLPSKDKEERSLSLSLNAASAFGFAAGTAKALAFLLAGGGIGGEAQSQAAGDACSSSTPIVRLAPHAILASKPRGASKRRLLYVVYVAAPDDDDDGESDPLVVQQMMRDSAEKLGLDTSLKVRRDDAKDAEAAMIVNSVDEALKKSGGKPALMMYKSLDKDEVLEELCPQKSLYEAAVEALSVFIDDDDEPPAAAGAGGKSVWEQISEAKEARVENLLVNHQQDAKDFVTPTKKKRKNDRALGIDAATVAAQYQATPKKKLKNSQRELNFDLSVGKSAGSTFPCRMENTGTTPGGKRHNKFYQVDVRGSEVIATWGPIDGSAAQVRQQDTSYGSHDEAVKKAEDVIAKKLKNHYKKVN